MFISDAGVHGTNGDLLRPVALVTRDTFFGNRCLRILSTLRAGPRREFFSLGLARRALFCVGLSGVGIEAVAFVCLGRSGAVPETLAIVERLRPLWLLGFFEFNISGDRSGDGFSRDTLTVRSLLLFFLISSSL